MSDQWGLAALVVAGGAILLTISPVSLNFIASIVSILLCTAWPILGKCESFEWGYISNGPLHESPINPYQCRCRASYETTWERAMNEFFKIRRGNFVRKPKPLSLFTTYIRTDTKTLKVFLSLLQPPIQITFKQVAGIMTAYVKMQQPPTAGHHPSCRLNVTKDEMEFILQGYPPWYQSPLALHGGRLVPHPILDLSDLSRGGWIVAVGLSPTLPIATDFMKRENSLVIHVNRALVRLVRCLSNLQQAFHHEKIVSDAFHLAEDVLSHVQRGPAHSGSILQGLFGRAGFHIGLLRLSQSEFSNKITEEQIKRTMKVFSYDEHLTGDDVVVLQHILDPILRACMFGIFKVVEHFYVTGDSQPYVLPPELDSDGLLYIRERWQSLED